MSNVPGTEKPIKQWKRELLESEYTRVNDLLGQTQRQLAAVQTKKSVDERGIFTRFVAPGVALIAGVTTAGLIYSYPEVVVKGVDFVSRQLGSTVGFKEVNELLKGHGMGVIGGVWSALSYMGSLYVLPPVMYGIMKLAGMIDGGVKGAFILHPIVGTGVLALLLAYYVGALQSGVEAVKGMMS